MGISTIDIRLLTADDWAVFRRVRLRTLSDTPQYFGSTLAEAQARTEQDWRSLLAGRAQFVAEADGVELGTVGGLPDIEHGGMHLVSMWVAPEARGTGVADQLVRAVLDLAAADGHAAVRLEVTDGNIAAERLYLRNGFVRTGVSGLVRPDDSRIEHEMVHEL